jgi:hypothetical protein
VHGEVRIFY